VVSDFRNFRFTWNGFFKWTGITLLAFLVAVIVTLYFLDWNQMRGPLSRYLSDRTGREVRIEGNLDVKLFTFQPIIDVGGLYIGNPGLAKDANCGPLLAGAKAKGNPVKSSAVRNAA